MSRDTRYFLPPSVHKWLPVHHLALERFIINVIDRLDLDDLKVFDPKFALGLARGDGALLTPPCIETTRASPCPKTRTSASW